MLCAALAVDHAKEPHAAQLAVDVEQVVNRHEQTLALPIHQVGLAAYVTRRRCGRDNEQPAGYWRSNLDVVGVPAGAALIEIKDADEHR